MTLYVLHKDGELYRGSVGRDWRAHKKTYVFVTRVVAENEAVSRAKNEKGIFEVVEYEPSISARPKAQPKTCPDDDHDFQVTGGQPGYFTSECSRCGAVQVGD